MKKKRLILITGAALFCALLFLIFFGNPAAARNEHDFGQAVKAVNSETVAFNDIVPFEWDKAYAFAPYTPEQEIEKIIGFESGGITETVNEGMTQLLFTKGNKVVCDICGYSNNLGYSVSLPADGGGNFQIIQYEDDAVFSVERIGGIVVLEAKQPRP